MVQPSGYIYFYIICRVPCHSSINSFPCSHTSGKATLKTSRPILSTSPFHFFIKSASPFLWQVYQSRVIVNKGTSVGKTLYLATLPATANGSATLTVLPTEDRHPPHSAATSRYCPLRSYPLQRVTPLRAVCRDLFPAGIYQCLAAALKKPPMVCALPW